MSERVSYTVENHIAHICLTRGDKMNALDHSMMDAIIDAGERLKADKDVRVAVLSGEGRAFCAGDFILVCAFKDVVRALFQPSRSQIGCNHHTFLAICLECSRQYQSPQRHGWSEMCGVRSA